MGLERDLRRTSGILFGALRAAGDQGLWPPLPDRSPATFRTRAAELVARLSELGVPTPEGVKGVPAPRARGGAMRGRGGPMGGGPRRGGPPPRGAPAGRGPVITYKRPGDGSGSSGGGSR